MQTIDLHGTPMPVLGYGTWLLTGDDCLAGVEDALRLGYRHIDTAQIYGNEREVGAAIRASGVPREQIFLTTKVWHTVLSREGVLRTTPESLERLGVDHVDLLLVHWPSPSVPLEETLGALLEVQAQGLTRHIGVSNFPSAQLRRARELAPIACNQVEHHVYLDQAAVWEACADDAVLVAYSPIARGQVLTDPVLQRIGAAHGKSPAQVALRYLVERNRVVIPKASSAKNRRENLAIFDFSLSDAERAEIATLARPDGRLIEPPWAPTWDT